MTLTDHVKAIHVFNEKNPQPNVISARIGPRAGQAKVATRMRLADSQKVIAIAEMSDGTFWTDEVDVIVTIAACLEDPV
jgi:sulfur-oxidizing protein SoxY